MLHSSQLHYRAAAGSRIVIRMNFELISVHKVNICFSFPCVSDLRDGDQFNGLTLQKKQKTIVNILHANKSSIM